MVASGRNGDVTWATLALTAADAEWSRTMTWAAYQAPTATNAATATSASGRRREAEDRRPVGSPWRSSDPGTVSGAAEVPSMGAIGAFAKNVPRLERYRPELTA